MPLPTPTPTDETDLRSREGAGSPESPAEGGRTAAMDPDAPVSFVPHVPVDETARPKPLRIRTGRFGELDEHELVRLLDTIEDERARARFRESVYISVFIWIGITLFAFFGPKYLWHSPRVVLPSEVLRAREVTQLTAPTLTAPHVRSAPPMDNHTLEHLRSSEPRVTPPAPRPVPKAETSPAQPHPEPRTDTRPLPSEPTPNPRPSPTTANLPPTPAPQPQPSRPPPPVVAEAPRPQPSSRPDFNTGSQNPGDQIQNAVRSATPGTGRAGGIDRHSRDGGNLGVGPAEILSDTQGVNFQPYLTRILREIYDTWIPLIPEEARPPLMKSGVTQIRFTILPDGSIGGMHIDGSTNDDALNRAAWGSITGVNQFPPLPPQFHGPNLELRIHYLVNRQTE